MCGCRRGLEVVHNILTRTLRAGSRERDRLSPQLHHWIDLVFGPLSSVVRLLGRCVYSCIMHYERLLFLIGVANIQADNVFYYLTYAGGVRRLESIDPMLRRATPLQITHYGQTPLQLLTSAHPARGPVPVLAMLQTLPLSPAAALHASLAEWDVAVPTRQARRRVGEERAP